jgi:hypothetical protein
MPKNGCGSAAVAVARSHRAPAPIALPEVLHHRWSLDLVSDMLTVSRRFQILCVV